MNRSFGHIRVEGVLWSLEGVVYLRNRVRVLEGGVAALEDGAH